MDSTSEFSKLLLILELLFAVHLLQAFIVHQSGCKIPLVELNSSKHGIILESKSMELKIPTDGYYHWNIDEIILIGCKTELRQEKCSVNKPCIDFTCKQPLQTQYKQMSYPNTSCADGIGTRYQIGFNINNSFIPYYKICYNIKSCSVIYSQYELLGAAFNNISRVKRAKKQFKEFACGNFNYHSQNNNPAIRASNWYFQKGHLFPDQDAPVFSWKEATYSFGNCAPQSNKTNSGNGNWLKLEKMVSHTAIAGKLKFNIFSGVLYTKNMSEKIFLDQISSRIEIPQWFWKAVISEDKLNAMIFFVSNNSTSSDYTNQQESIFQFCNGTNNCDEYGWDFDNDVEKGNIQCCNQTSLKEGILPKEVDVIVKNNKTDMGRKRYRS